MRKRGYIVVDIWRVRDVDYLMSMHRIPYDIIRNYDALGYATGIAGDKLVYVPQGVENLKHDKYYVYMVCVFENGGARKVVGLFETSLDAKRYMVDEYNADLNFG